jgi:hypothetical protein
MPLTVKLPNDEHMFNDTKLQKSTLISRHGELVVIVGVANVA